MYNILIVGVGGQGVLTMFKILGQAALNQGFQVNGAETHGMSQRGGSVYVHLRINDGKVFSPLIMEGQADLLVSLEPMEALRFASFVKTNGTILTSMNCIDPPNIAITKNKYPPLEEIIVKLHEHTPHVVSIDFESLLGISGLRNINIAALGSISTLIGFPITMENLINEIKHKLGKNSSNALNAFELGINANGYTLLDAK